MKIGSLRPAPVLKPRPEVRPGGDRFVASRPTSLGLIPRLFMKKTEEAIPDAESVANNPELHGVELNRAINRTYVPLANQLQKALDPYFDNGSLTAPSWYAMAIYASRGAGQGMLAAQRALDVVTSQEDPMKALQAAFPLIPAEDWAGLDQPGRSPEMTQAMAFLTAYSLAKEEQPRRLTLDPRILTISATRLAHLLLQPGVNLGTVVTTLLNTLEDGNRRIFRDIGVSAQHFLELRRDQPGLTPEMVLERFSDCPQEAARAYQDGLRWAEGSQSLPTDFGNHYSFDTKHLLAAGLALYQRASGEAQPALRDRLIAHAGNLLAYHEQVNVAVPAFLPGEIKPGETDRAAVMQIITPQVDVKTRHWQWRFSEFPQDDLDGSQWTPPCTERNWGTFVDRWPPILDYFNRCYAQPASIWPMPHPDPAQPVNADEGVTGCVSTLFS